MAPWIIKAFSGEQPRTSPNLLPPNAAQWANNVRLDDGALTPLREPSHTSSFGGYAGGYQTIFRYQNTWLGWTTVVNCVPGPVAQDRLYLTGDGVPKMRVGATAYSLKVPFPTAALTATVSGTPTDPTSTIVSRVYVYTYVTAYGEESEPSAAATAVNWQAGQTVTLSGFQAAPAGRNITLQRIYRTQTGSSGTDLYFIAGRAASAVDFVDTVADTAFGEVIPSRAYNAPPDTLAGLTAMPNGMMAGFVGRDIYFCEPWIPHAWPQAYVLSADFDIVALGSIGTSLVVMTTGNPYLVQGTHPSSMQMAKMETSLPCLSARGVVDLGSAIAYPSHDGLVLASASGQASVVTKTLFSRDDWQQLNPATLTAAQLYGHYVAAYNSTDAAGKPLVGTIIIYADSGSAFLGRTDVVTEALHYSVKDSALYFLMGTGEIKRLDPPSGAPVNLYWKSRPLLLPAADNFAVIMVDAEDNPSAQDTANINAQRAAAAAVNAALLANPLGSEMNGALVNQYALAGDNLVVIPSAAKKVTVNVIADGVKVAAISEAGKAVRLPSGFRARKWEVEVFGTMRIEQIAVGRTPLDLKMMGAT